MLSCDAIIPFTPLTALDPASHEGCLKRGIWEGMKPNNGYVWGTWNRQMFANQQLARAAAEKEIEEARARTAAQHALAAAQQQAAQRALTVAREKAANEAKSEFMSLMCHEVRTPLNGCLASAEMLLDSDLQVRRALCRPLSDAAQMFLAAPL